MNLQRCITITMLFVFCLPLVVMSAPPQYEDLTYGFLGAPLPSDVTLYEGVVDFVPEEGGFISINDTLYPLKQFTVYLSPFKTKTSLDYFKPDTTVQFYAHVQDKVIYEILAVSSPETTTTDKQDTPVLQDGVWRN